jgi:signal transduction histidine kinase
MELYGQGDLRFVGFIAAVCQVAVKGVGSGHPLGWLCCVGRTLWFRGTDWPASGDPTYFLASPGFFALCAAASLYALCRGYVWHIRQISRRIRRELRPRLQERENTNCDPHDVLLQAMQGLLLRFQIISDHLAPLQRSRSVLDEAMNRTDALIIDSRDSVGRPHTAEREGLPGLLLGLADGLACGPPIDVWVTIEGSPRDIQPAAQEAIKCIAAEALSNSFRHAQADNIEICVVYHRKHLVVQLRDDGVGLNQVELDRQGLAGRFGLLEMTTQAHLLGGKYSISSRPKAGTMVQLRLPPSVAYNRAPAEAA